MTIRNLDALFKPDAVALICGGGGSEEVIARNLMSGGFPGPVLPGDAKRNALAGAPPLPVLSRARTSLACRCRRRWPSSPDRCGKPPR